MILARKINKIHEFYVIFALKCPKIIIAGKILPEFWGHVTPCPRLLRLWVHLLGWH